MKKKAKRTVPLPAAAQAGVVLACALAAVVLTSLAGISERPTRIWRGFYTLLIRQDRVRAGALEKVAHALGPGVVSERTATVSYWSFTGVQTIPVDLIDTRIDPSDPRHDRVMDDLPGYFRRPGPGGGRSIVYVPALRVPVVDFLSIAAVLGLPWQGTWSLEEFDPIEFLVSAACLLALAALLAHPSGKGGRERLFLAGAGTLLWIPFLLPGGIARLSLSLLLLAAWFPAVQSLVEFHGWDKKLLREARRPIVMFLAAAGGGFVLLVPGSGFSAAAVVSYAGSAAGSVLLVVAMALLWGKAHRPRRRRKVFDPVPIVKTTDAPHHPRPASFVLPFAAVLVVATIGILRSVPLPTPVAVPGARDFSWESLSRLSRENRAEGLPDVSDLAAHEAYQETLAFGRPWGLPRRDERVYVREFSTNPGTGTIVPVMRRVKVFDAEWLAAAFRNPPAGSIEALLVSQRRPMEVAVRGQTRDLLRELPVALMVLFVFSAWFAWEHRTTPLMRSVLLRFNGAARRNQVP
jgi:hypothetical protein